MNADNANKLFSNIHPAWVESKSSKTLRQLESKRLYDSEKRGLDELSVAATATEYLYQLQSTINLLRIRHLQDQVNLQQAVESEKNIKFHLGKILETLYQNQRYQRLSFRPWNYRDCTDHDKAPVTTKTESLENINK
jgi:hypothetical protein